MSIETEVSQINCTEKTTQEPDVSSEVEIKSNNDELFFEYFKAKDKKLRNKIAEKNQALVTFIIKKYYSSKAEHQNLRDDLLQEGCLGLLSAIDGFDPYRGYKFSTYGTWWIRQAINNYLINLQPIIQVPTHVRAIQNKLIKKLKEENKELEELISNSSETNKNKEYDVTDKMLKSISMAVSSKFVKSIDEEITVSEEGKTSLKDLLEDDNVNSESTIDYQYLVQVLASGLKTLSIKERLILLLRFQVIIKEDVPRLIEQWTKKNNNQTQTGKNAV